ncbi:methylenetetrahydrofolate reductase [NAD(P)H] [Actinotignum urinale]|uniref:methylenetetrahydrofolate reductase [NAD(P)H] n=1 Tax=Actinotignum urinale TaxID=190146 RepID=UPI002A82A2AB|nr:methylenetetrahydrofolate reductase [NAD(P)H] [Actinotignum urinale]MDY5150882.1 methylenetetrahydrofolate reductase [NAD(P)H] [Actinotignum urinale]
MRRPIFSLEVFPPRRNATVGTIYDTLDGLADLQPDFISVTYGHGSQSDRTITARIAHTIRQEYRIPVVTHLTALYSSEERVDQTLDMFEAAGVRAVLALRGDQLEGYEPQGRFNYANELVAYIREKHPDMLVFGACYPEGHSECPDMKQDVENLKRKVDAGATILISQLFYDNEKFYRFRDMLDAAGITVPVEAGIMPITSMKSTINMAKRGGVTIPKTVYSLLDKWGDDTNILRSAGVVYASQQISDLAANGVDGIHLYTMNHPGDIRRIWGNVQNLFEKDDGRRL